MESITNLPHIGFVAKVINQQPNSIPIEFIWPDKEKPSNDVKELQVPIMDISRLLSGQDHHVSASQASRLVTEAAKIHGFFIITNHGVQEGILSRKVKREWGEISGYSDSFVGRFYTEFPWKETLSFRFSAEEKLKNGTETVKDYISRTMGDINEEFG
ncbi:hypothetical protein ARALYDRAFT_919471 [Arabidopsis lyrata subsp. lyrata]|uniref:Non-haem dioxygenase N-terminal domain-containing protein n=1 Tax=Arabidopsis lyrata subsp. lyrata TaxID=81972 RepID=D7MLB2_ARALL|nr:hypothetical protein ARALYDRAFT_919471 [Arabidopsis lyrata subsp. lyrata]